MRPYADNVWLKLDPLSKATASGIVLVEGERKSKGTRRATVVASGAGHVTKLGAFVENEIKAGETVYVYALAGQDWQYDFDAPRHNMKIEFDQVAGERGEYRVARAAEILAREAADGSVQAVADYIIVRRTEVAQMSPGGIHIPESHAPRPLTGAVLSVGSGRVREDGKRHALGVGAGETVMFQRFAGSEIDVRGETLLLLREDDLLCVLDAEAAKAVEAA